MIRRHTRQKGFDIQDVDTIKGPVSGFLSAASSQQYMYGYVTISAGNRPAPSKIDDFGLRNDGDILLGAAHIFDPLIDGKQQAITFIRQMIRLPYNLDRFSRVRVIEYFRLRPALVLRTVSASVLGRPEPVTPPTRDQVVSRIERWLQVIEDGLGAVRDRPILMIAPNYATQYELLKSPVIANHAIWLADGPGHEGKPDVPPGWHIDMWQESVAAQIGVNVVGRDYAINLGRVPSQRIVRKMTATRFSFLTGAVAGGAVWALANRGKARFGTSHAYPYRRPYLPTRP